MFYISKETRFDPSILLGRVNGRVGWDFSLELPDGVQHLPFSRSRRGRTLAGLLLSSVQASLCPSPAGRPCRPPLKKRFISVLERCKAPFSPGDPDFSFFRCFFSSVDMREPPGGLEGGQKRRRAQGDRKGQREGEEADGVCCHSRVGSSPCLPPLPYHPAPGMEGIWQVSVTKQAWASQAGVIGVMVGLGPRAGTEGGFGAQTCL